MNYATVFDAGNRAFQWGPLAVILIGPLVILLIIAIGNFRLGSVPRDKKLTLWGGYAIIAAINLAQYGFGWSREADAREARDAKVITGRLADPWVRQQHHRKTTDVYQHFTVRGVEFLERRNEPSLVAWLMVSNDVPPLPLIEGARVRITYRGSGSERTILKFEIVADDMPADQASLD